MKKWTAALLCLCLLLPVRFSCRAETAEPGPGVGAPSALLMTLSGQTLWEKDAHAPREPASVTKVMTLLLVCEAIDSGSLSLEDTVTASAYASSMGGSQIWLKEGETLSLIHI